MRRTLVWVAMGVLKARQHLSSIDALASMRGDARGLGVTPDDVAERVVAGALPA